MNSKVVVMMVGIAFFAMQFMPSSAQDTTATAACLKKIGTCLVNNSNDASKFDTSSPSFNISEALCCPLIQEAANNEKACFCAMNTLIQGNTTLLADATAIFTICQVPDTVDSLNKFCQGVVVPSLAPSALLPPIGPSMVTLKALTPSTASNKTSDSKGAASKIVITGSFSILLVLLVNLVFLTI